MRLERFRDGVAVERIEHWDALVFLAADAGGKVQHIFDIGTGSAEVFRELFIHGFLNWPSLILYDEETQKCLYETLKDVPFVDISHERFVSEDIREAAFFSDILEREDVFVLGGGDEEFRFEGLPFCKFPLTFSHIGTSLLFIRQDGQNLIGTNGAGSQKSLLTFHAVEALFGSDVSDLVEDVILGLSRPMWHKMANVMRGAEDGEIVIVEDNDEADESEEDELL